MPITRANGYLGAVADQCEMSLFRDPQYVPRSLGSWPRHLLEAPPPPQSHVDDPEVAPHPSSRCPFFTSSVRRQGYKKGTAASPRYLGILPRFSQGSSPPWHKIPRLSASRRTRTRGNALLWCCCPRPACGHEAPCSPRQAPPSSGEEVFFLRKRPAGIRLR